MDFSIVERAGLSQTEFAQILGVSRLTAHKYIKGKSTPHFLGAKRVEGVLDLLTRLVVKGTLPAKIGERDFEARRRMMTKLTAFIADKVDN